MYPIMKTTVYKYFISLFVCLFVCLFELNFPPNRPVIAGWPGGRVGYDAYGYSENGSCPNVLTKIRIFCYYTPGNRFICV